MAIWLHGGLGTGHFSQGQPVIEKILEQLKDTFHLVVYSKSKPNDDYESKNLTIRSADKRIKSEMLRWFLLVKYFITDHKRQQFDIIFAFWGYPAGTFAVVLGKLFKKPSLIYLQGGDTAGISSINYGVFHKYWLRKLVVFIYQRASSIICLTNYQCDQLRNFGITKEIKIIPIGVNLSLFPFTEKSFSNTLKILHVGHLNPVKDQSTLLKAFTLILQKKSAFLQIAGVDAGQKNFLVALCQELNVTQHVKFVGIIPHAEMAHYYAWADVILQTSLSEGQGLALTEAAASGTLLAGTKVGLLHDLDDKAAIRVELGDYQTLANTVLLLLNDNEKWNSKIKVAREWAENHSLDWTIDELKKHLKQFV